MNNVFLFLLMVNNIFALPIKKKKKFINSASWDAIGFKVCDEVSWWKLIWFLRAIPRHTFVLCG